MDMNCESSDHLDLDLCGIYDGNEDETDRCANSKDKNVSTGNKQLSKSRRKLNKKSAKAIGAIAKNFNIEVSREPTNWVVVWGLGVLSGTSKTEVLHFFDPKPVEIRFVDQENYCFCKFRNSSDAEASKEAKDGFVYSTQQIIYLGYLTTEPPMENQTMILPFKATPPSGFKLIPSFISEKEEDDLIRCFTENSAVGGALKHRVVKHYGFEFKYDTNNVDHESPLSEGIPECTDTVIKKMIDKNIITRKPEQLTVNIYKPGQGIPPHIDTHSPFESPIISLSLGSDTVMDFRYQTQHASVILPRRSLVVMNGACRYQWTHGIASRKFDVVPEHSFVPGVTILKRNTRISLTFRLLRPEKICLCPYPKFCDSQNGKISSENAVDLENSLVHQIYENIASHFSETRHTPWPKVNAFIRNLPLGSICLDAGCGNGKNMNLNENICLVGGDMSSGLLEIAKGKGCEVLRANILDMPFRDESFDAVICIAVLHHLSTLKRRLKGLSEILRVLKDGGEALIYCWAKEQARENNMSSWVQKQGLKENVNPVNENLSVEHDFPFLPVYNAELEFSQPDILVPWTKGNNKDGNKYHRYYHVFSEGELEDLCKILEPRLEIIERYYEQGNWVVRFKKQAINSAE